MKMIMKCERSFILRKGVCDYSRIQIIAFGKIEFNTRNWKEKTHKNIVKMPYFG